MLSWLRRQWAAYKGYWDFRVIYDTGEHTYRLTFREAESLAKVFGGTVVYDPLPQVKG